jgi:uncharacterized protein (UPF0276 family)
VRFLVTMQDMPDIKLSADISDALLELLCEDRELVDAVEVGPWFTPEQIRAYRNTLPAMPFHFHAADMIEEVDSVSGIEARIDEYLACTGSPWVSVHISVWEPGEVGKIKAGEQVPLPDSELGLQRFVHNVNRLAQSVCVPVLIENIEPLPLDGYDFWAWPEFICRVLTETGCSLLLDTGHARLAAERFEMDARDYLQQLPLECVEQVHVSGPRLVNGYLTDAHQPLLEEDYGLLEFLLQHCHPQVVTLEYIQDVQALKEQLTRLRKLIK